MSDYDDLDATGMAEAIRSGRASAEELLSEARVRLERADARLGLLAHRFEAPPRFPTHDGAPFAGVPFLLKDHLDLAGHPMTLGTRLLDGVLPERTHPFFERLLGTGLVALGRTTMSELGFLPTTEPLTQAPTGNPWHPEHSPGGSSGGSAAAVAAGVLPMAHAADGGGSIRIPASACGLVGLKPSRGRHPTAEYDPPFGFVSEGVVSRTVRDTAAALDAVCGARPGDYAVPPPERPFVEHAARDPGPLRIGLTPRGLFGEKLHPEVEAALLASARRLEALGHHIEEVEPPFRTADVAPSFGVVWAAGAGVTTRFGMRTMDAEDASPLVKLLAQRRGGLRKLLALPGRKGPRIQPFTRYLMDRDADLSPSEMWLAHVVFGEIRASLEAWFASGFDLWLTATLNRPPVRIGELDPSSILPSAWRGDRARRSGRARGGLPMHDSDDAIGRYLLGYTGATPVANLTGAPALSLPMGFSGEPRLPLGMHLLGPIGGEATLLELAGQWERAHPWPRMAPPS